MKILKTALLLSIAILLTSDALAHKVNLFATESEGRVCAEGYTADGRATKSSTLMVFSAEGEKLLEGKTDGEGVFCFERPGNEALELKLEAGPGHMASFTLPASQDEAEDGKVSKKPLPEPQGGGGPSILKVLLGLLIIAGLGGVYLLIARSGGRRDAP